MRDELLAKLDQIVDGVDNTKGLIEIHGKMIDYVSPKNFVGVHSAEVLYNKRFEDTCLLISKELNIDIDSMTVLRFYSAMEYMKKQVDELKKLKNGR